MKKTIKETFTGTLAVQNMDDRVSTFVSTDDKKVIVLFSDKRKSSSGPSRMYRNGKVTVTYEYDTVDQVKE